jgi:hypothetical protein
MSEKKKAFVETTLEAAGPANPPVDGGESSSKDTVIDSKLVEADSSQRPRGPNVLPDILGKQLRAAYGELLSSPVPDRFNDLIKKLEHREAQDAESGSSQDGEVSQ